MPQGVFVTRSLHHEGAVPLPPPFVAIPWVSPVAGRELAFEKPELSSTRQVRHQLIVRVFDDVHHHREPWPPVVEHLTPDDHVATLPGHEFDRNATGSSCCGDRVPPTGSRRPWHEEPETDRRPAQPGGTQFERHMDDSVRRTLDDRELGMAKQAQHRLVVGEGVGDESRDAALPGELGETGEQERADPSSLPAVGHDERHFGLAGLIQAIESRDGHDLVVGDCDERFPVCGDRRE